VATPKGAGLQKTNGVEDNFLGVRIWVLFFALLISAAVVGYVIARSTKPATPAASTAAPGYRGRCRTATC
jgi:hypothetical protein